MKKLLPPLLVFIGVLLSGCPDSKMPKVPPSTPAPKASVEGSNAGTVQAPVRIFSSRSDTHAPA